MRLLADSLDCILSETRGEAASLDGAKWVTLEVRADQARKLGYQEKIRTDRVPEALLVVVTEEQHNRAADRYLDAKQKSQDFSSHYSSRSSAQRVRNFTIDGKYMIQQVDYYWVAEVGGVPLGAIRHLNHIGEPVSAWTATMIGYDEIRARSRKSATAAIGNLKRRLKAGV